MAKYELVGSKADEKPMYQVADATYALEDEELDADMAAEGVGAPIGTIVTKAGYAAMKQKGHDGSWTTI